MPQFAYNPQSGEFVSNGGSLATRSTDETAYAQTSSGTVLHRHIAGKDEMGAIRAYFWEKGITSVAGTALNGFRTAESTKRILSGHSVEKLGIRAVRDVKLAEIPHLPEVPVIPAIPAM